MVYKTERPKMGLTIKITSHRKHGNGAIGSDRQNTTGMKATVSRKGSEDFIVTGSTKRALLKEVRRQFKIPPDTKINEVGETCI